MSIYLYLFSDSLQFSFTNRGLVTLKLSRFWGSLIPSGDFLVNISLDFDLYGALKHHLTEQFQSIFTNLGALGELQSFKQVSL